ncbi:MAG: WD40/YVTN/BNR-like repeat-containing protein [Gammaproteobacteria bacterium]
MIACLCPNGLNRYDGPQAPRRLLVATASGINVLERDAIDQPWRVAGIMLPGVHATTLAMIPGRTNLLAGTHGDGIFFSADDGKHWEPRNEGMTSKDVYSIVAIEQDGGITLYAGTQPASLFRSRDLGQSWFELPALREVPSAKYWTFPAPPHLAHTKMMVFDPRDPNVFYVAIEQGALLVTRDGGNSWCELNSYSRPDDKFRCDVHQLLLLPSSPETIFMSTGVGLYKSLDAGENWERLTGADFRLAYPDHLALSPDESSLFMAGARHEPGEWRRTHLAETGVVCSRDGGHNWTECRRLNIAPGANLEAMAIASYPGGYTLFVGDTEGMVYASDDGGDNWVFIADVLASVSKGDHAKALRGTTRHYATPAELWAKVGDGMKG